MESKNFINDFSFFLFVFLRSSLTKTEFYVGSVDAKVNNETANVIVSSGKLQKQKNN